MSTRAEQFTAEVLSKSEIGPHLLRLQVGGISLSGWKSTGIPDEWVGLTPPGQFQSRYYTVRAWTDDTLTLDVVVHESGLVTEWASGDCVGDTVMITEPKGSFDLPADAEWLYLVGDLTGAPAMARIVESVRFQSVVTDLRVWAEVPDDLDGYFDSGLGERLTWLDTPVVGSQLAAVVEKIEFPSGPGYFWMAGESAQMRAIRKHLMRVVKLPSHAYDVMGYWRTKAPTTAVDPGPIYREGKAAGLSDAEIWERYDQARED